MYNYEVSTHSRPKAAGAYLRHDEGAYRVSTHSRPKAAGAESIKAVSQVTGFNTQPPEGGWAQSTH